MYNENDDDILLGNVGYLLGAIFSLVGLLICYAAYLSGDNGVMLKGLIAYVGIQAILSTVGTLFGLFGGGISRRGFLYWVIAWAIFLVMLLTSYGPGEALEMLIGLSVVPFAVGALVGFKIWDTIIKLLNSD